MVSSWLTYLRPLSTVDKIMGQVVQDKIRVEPFAERCISLSFRFIVFHVWRDSNYINSENQKYFYWCIFHYLYCDYGFIASTVLTVIQC